MILDHMTGVIGSLLDQHRFEFDRVLNTVLEYGVDPSPPIDSI